MLTSFSAFLQFNMVELISHRKWIIGILVAINAVYFMSKQGGKNGGFKFGLMGFDVPHVICISPSALSEPIEQLSFSTVIIILICASSHFLRQGVEEYVKDSLIKILLQEAIAAADLCGCCFELIIGEFSKVWGGGEIKGPKPNYVSLLNFIF